MARKLGCSGNLVFYKLDWLKSVWCHCQMWPEQYYYESKQPDHWSHPCVLLLGSAKPIYMDEPSIFLQSVNKIKLLSPISRIFYRISASVTCWRNSRLPLQCVSTMNHILFDRSFRGKSIVLDSPIIWIGDLVNCIRLMVSCRVQHIFTFHTHGAISFFTKSFKKCTVSPTSYDAWYRFINSSKNMSLIRFLCLNMPKKFLTKLST